MIYTEKSLIVYYFDKRHFFKVLLISVCNNCEIFQNIEKGVFLYINYLFEIIFYAFYKHFQVNKSQPANMGIIKIHNPDFNTTIFLFASISKQTWMCWPTGKNRFISQHFFRSKTLIRNLKICIYSKLNAPVKHFSFFHFSFHLVYVVIDQGIHQGK